MATAAWSRLRAPPLHSGATDTLFGLPVHGCHVPDLWLTGSAPSLGDTRATDEDLRASPPCARRLRARPHARTVEFQGTRSGHMYTRYMVYR